jgi:hypothetical protein
MDKRYYLAYGSNLNIGQMKTRCPSARIIGTAFIENYQLLFKGSKTGSYLTIEPNDGGAVPVAVWSVSKDDERRLDCYEGFPNFYYKKELRLPIKGIRTGTQRIRDAFVYIMHEERPLGIPSPWYFDVCREGYADFGFDITLLANAVLNSKED